LADIATTPGRAEGSNRDFASAVETAGKPVSLLTAEGSNHFEMLEALANPYGLLGSTVLSQMGVR